MELKSVAKIQDNLSVVYIADDHTIWEQLGFNEEQLGFIKKQVAAEAFPIVINDYHRLRIISYFKKRSRCAYCTRKLSHSRRRCHAIAE